MTLWHKRGDLASKVNLEPQGNGGAGDDGANDGAGDDYDDGGDDDGDDGGDDNDDGGGGEYGYECTGSESIPGNSTI